MTTMIWCNVAIVPQFSWPNIPIALPFAGKTIVLSPPTDVLACRASLLDPQSTTFEAGATLLSRFLSRLAWSMDGGVVEIFHLGTNNPKEPGRLGQGTSGRWARDLVDPPNYIYVPSASEPESDLALALYREGLSVNSVPFAFLSFFKILNIRHGRGDAQERWINDNLTHLRYQPAIDRLRELQSDHHDIGNYMYVQGRCAVSHAHADPIANPDTYTDKRRLSSDLPLMQALAALFVERELKVKSTSSYHRQCDPKADMSELLMKGPVVDGRLIYAPRTPAA